MGKTMTTIEKAARALYEQIDPMRDAMSWEDRDEFSHAHYKAAVRAVLEAIREPTPEMIAASGCECGTDGKGDMTREEYVRRDFRAMIDTILEEG